MATQAFISGIHRLLHWMVHLQRLVGDWVIGALHSMKSDLPLTPPNFYGI